LTCKSVSTILWNSTKSKENHLWESIKVWVIRSGIANTTLCLYRREERK
jgi:hypothetical protein